MKIIYAVTLMAACSMIGCTTDSATICEHAQNVADSLVEKTKNCASINAAMPSIPAKDACENAIDNCGTADRILLEKAFDCIDGLPSCAGGNESDFQRRADICLALAATMSDSCRNSFLPKIN